MRERIKQARRPLTEKERADLAFSNQEWRQDRLATRELIFSLTLWIGSGLRREWRDGAQPLEQHVPDIIAVLAIAGPILEERRLEAEAAEQRRWEDERRRREEQERQDQDRNRWRRLVEYAQAWRDAQLVGDFIKAIEALSGGDGRLHGDKSSIEWLRWARERRDAFDPACWTIADLWHDVASVTAWQYPGSR